MSFEELADRLAGLRLTADGPAAPRQAVAVDSGPPPRRLVPGASIVETLSYTLVQQLGHEVLDIAGILLVWGPPGHGKTCATAELARAVAVPVVWIHLAAAAKGNEVLRALLAGLGEEISGPTAVLLERARTSLAGRRLLVCVDEANLLNREALHQLRYLFDQPNTTFALVLTGSDFTRAWGAAPELESRISRQVEFGPLAGTRLTRALASFHPVLAATEPTLLRQIDRECAGGSWRTWEKVLVAAIGRGATAADGISEAVSRAVVGTVPPAPGVRRAHLGSRLR
jgi:hypothetical protein